MSILASNGELTYYNCANYDFIGRMRLLEEAAPEAAHVRCTSLRVWGGIVANCAEHELSALVDENAASLRSVLYMPQRTKGGVLIRPKYYCGDRVGRTTFPVLKALAIRCSPALLPADYGWVTPALEELTILVDPDVTCERDVARWLDLSDAGLCELVRTGGTGRVQPSIDPAEQRSCPDLHRVHLVLCRTDDQGMGQVLLMSAKFRFRPDWEVERLLHIVAAKPDTTDETTAVCHAALGQALPMILQYLADKPVWTLSKKNAPSQAELARIGLMGTVDWPGKEIDAASWPEQAKPLAGWLRTLSKVQ